MHAEAMPTRHRSHPRLALGLLLLGLCAFSLACYSPTSYERSSIWSEGYGWSDKPLGDGEHSVVFRANSLTTDARTVQLALLRAAYLTLEQGGQRFVVVDQAARRRLQELIRSAAVSDAGWTIVVPVDRRTTSEPVVVLLIRVLSPEAPVADGEILASEVIERLDTELR